MKSSGDPGKYHPHEVFSPSNAAHLDTRLRQFIYRPDQLAERFIRPGDRVLDFGCGPGFFTRAFAKAAGDSGTVIAADLQEEMLNIVREKMQKEGLLSRVRTHRCLPDTLNLTPDQGGMVDVATAIFVVHEVPDPEKLFREIAALVKPGGTFFYSEPFFIVPGREFTEHLAEAEAAGFRVEERSYYFLNRAAVMRKE